MALFLPDIYLDKIINVDISTLIKKGIKAVVLDVDNTLTHHDSQIVTDEVISWLKNAKENGLQLTIVSNNNEKRIKPFADKIGLEYIASGCKPLTIGFTKACKKYSLKPEQIAVIGDQIYTDILGGNLKGMYTILVTPFEYETGRLFKLKRRLEKIHINKYNKKHNG